MAPYVTFIITKSVAGAYKLIHGETKENSLCCATYWDFCWYKNQT